MYELLRGLEEKGRGLVHDFGLRWELVKDYFYDGTSVVSLCLDSNWRTEERSVERHNSKRKEFSDHRSRTEGFSIITEDLVTRHSGVTEILFPYFSFFHDSYSHLDLFVTHLCCCYRTLYTFSDQYIRGKWKEEGLCCLLTKGQNERLSTPVQSPKTDHLTSTSVFIICTENPYRNLGDLKKKGKVQVVFPVIDFYHCSAIPY